MLRTVHPPALNEGAAATLPSINCFLPGSQTTSPCSNNSCSFSPGRRFRNPRHLNNSTPFAFSLLQICPRSRIPGSPTAGAAGPVTFASGWLRPTSGSQVTTAQVPHSTLYLSLLPTRPAPPPKRHPTAPSRLRRPAGYVKAVLVTATAFQLGRLSPSRPGSFVANLQLPNSSQAPDGDRLPSLSHPVILPTVPGYTPTARVEPASSSLAAGPRLGPRHPRAAGVACCLICLPLATRSERLPPSSSPGNSAAARHDSRPSTMVLPPPELQE